MAWRDDDDRPDGEDEADEEMDENDYRTQKDAVLFAIDVSKSMMKAPPPSHSKKAEKDSALTAALKGAYQLMRQRIISQPKDLMGILLFGTKKSKFRDEINNKANHPHCYLLVDLDVPSAEVVKTLRDMAEKGENPDEVLIPTDETVHMDDVLFCANQLFTTNAPNFGSRRLFVVTDNDDPLPGDKQARSRATVRAKDLFDLGATIELFPMSREGDKFSLDKFYADIIYVDPAANTADPEGQIKIARSGDGVTLLASLVSSINSKQTPKRAYFANMPFEIAPGLTISVNGYMVVHRQQIARSCYVYLDSDNAQLVQGETTRTENDTERTVSTTEIKKAYKFGGEFVHFSPEELKRIREFESKCIRIIGFKPRSLLPPWASVKKSIYMFPTEGGYVGSSRVFSALWQKLLRSNKMAIAWYIPRVNATPLLVAILPSRNRAEEPGPTDLPTGLWIYPLPFVDDVRDIETIKPKPPEAVYRAPEDLINDMRIIVRNLQLPKAVYDPAKYPNPALQWHYKILQAMALDEAIPEDQGDHTVPKYKAIAKRVGGYQVGFSNSVSEEAQHLARQTSIKREFEDDAGGRPKKRAKMTTESRKHAGGMSLAQLKVPIDGETLQKMTVADLKSTLAEKGLGTTGKKTDLLERLEQWVEDNS